MKVELSAEANAQAQDIDTWWREHRRAALDLFTDELDRALLTLGETPGIGASYTAGARTVRRLLLERSHYHLYYEVQNDRVFVLAVWSAFRGRSPRL